MEKQIRKPEQTVVSGVVVGISEMLERKERKFRMLIIETAPNQQRQVPLAEKFYSRVKDQLVLDTNVSITLQHTIAGSTQYLDANGDVQTHTSTGDAVVSVVRQSSIAAKTARLDDKIKELARQYEDNPALLGSLVNAYATLFK